MALRPLCRALVLMLGILVCVCLRVTPAQSEEVVEVWRSPFGTAWAVAVDETDGSCWAATGNRVTHLAADGTILSETAGFKSPASLSVNTTDHSCWVADTGHEELAHLSASGVELCRRQYSAVLAVSVDSSNGCVWVGSDFGYVALLEPDGSQRWLHWDYSGVSSVAADPGDHSGWLVDSPSDRVLHLDADGHEIPIFPPVFYYPLSVAVDRADHSVWVAEWGGDVLHLGSDGSELNRSGWLDGPFSLSVNAADHSCWVAVAGTAWLDPGAAVHLAQDCSEILQIPALSEMRGVAVNADPDDGSCWVAEGATVGHFAADGTEVWRGGAFSGPLSVSANPSDHSCWVADTGNNQIAHITAAYEIWRSDGYPTFSSPRAVSADPDSAPWGGSCWVADTGNNQIAHISATYEEVWRSSAEQFSGASALSACSGDGSCRVGDPGHNHLVSIDANHDEAWRSGAPWPADGFSPISVSAYANGSSWVFDSYSRRFVCLDANGVAQWWQEGFFDPRYVSHNPEDSSSWVVGPGEIAHFAQSGSVLDWWNPGIGGVYAVSVWPADGSIWVTADERVVHYAIDRTELWNGTGFCCPQSVSADPDDGSVWVADTNNSQIVHLMPIEVSGPPTAAFSGSPTSGSAPLEVCFTDVSTGAPTSWSWDFGDGGATAEQNPCHTYGNPGAYTVSLTVGNASGADSETEPDYIVVDASEHSVSVTANCTTNPVNSGGSTLCLASFSDTLGHGASSWHWEDGGAGGSFWPSPDQQNTFYYAPTNASETDLPVTLTATATCDGAESASGQGSFTLTVRPVTHTLSVSADCDPHEVFPEGATNCTASYSDSRGHQVIAWEWSDRGSGGWFDPSAHVQNPVYHAPATGWLTLTVSATCDGPDPLTVSADTWLDVIPPPPPTGTIAGTVVDTSTGEPVWGAQVWCGWGLAVNAGPDGAYVILGVAEGADYTVTATMPGYAWGSVSGVAVVASQTTVVDFALTALPETVVEDWRGGSGYAVSVDSSNHSCWVAAPHAEGYDPGDERLIRLAASGAELWRGAGFPGIGSVSANSGDHSCWAGSFNGWGWHVSADHIKLLEEPIGPVTAVAANPADNSCWVGTTAVPFGAGSVAHLAEDGTVLWPSPEELFYIPASLSVNTSDRSVWVADYDYENAWGVHFGHSVTHLREDGSVLWRGADFGAPRSVSVYPDDGSCWVADEDDFQVMHLAEDGSELWSSGFPQPTAVAVNSTDGSVWVGSAWGGIAHLNRDGAMLWWDWLSDGIGSISVDSGDRSCWVASGGQVVHLKIVGGCELPVAAFSGNPTSDCAPLEVCFTDASTGNPTSWSWDFGDGGTSTEQNPCHTYNAPGNCTVSLAVTNECGSNTETKTSYIAVGFSDTCLPEWDWAFRQIIACHEAGIVGGYPDGTYHPDEQVNRAQMAVFISRARAGGDTSVPTGPPTATFSDVPTDYWAFRYVEYCYDQGVVTGYWDGYHPEETVSRAQMAVYVSRAMAGGDGNVPDDPDATPFFPDVAATYWAYKYVEYCHDHSVVGGYWDGYHPEETVNRAQMAVCVQRAFALPM